MENLVQGLNGDTGRDRIPEVQLLHPLSQFEGPNGQNGNGHAAIGKDEPKEEIEEIEEDEEDALSTSMVVTGLTTKFEAPSGQNSNGHAVIGKDEPKEEIEEKEEEEDALSTSIVNGLTTKYFWKKKTKKVGRRGIKSECYNNNNNNIPNPVKTRFHHNKKIWKLLLSAALFAMYPSLAQVCQLKFRDKSPFETHVFFSITSVVAYIVAIPAAVAFFKMASFLEGLSMSNTSSLCIYLILRCILCFSLILANLSLVLLLLIPTSNYYLIGYVIISLLFVVIVIYNVIDYLKIKWVASKET